MITALGTGKSKNYQERSWVKVPQMVMGLSTVVLSAQLSGALGPYPVELPHPFVVSYIFL